MKLNKRALGAVGTAFIIAGCASVPEAVKADRDQALTFSPPPGKARVYVIRSHHFVAAATRFGFALDRQIPVGDCSTTSHRPGWPLYSCIDTVDARAGESRDSFMETYESEVLSRNAGGVLGLRSYLYADVGPGLHVFTNFLYYENRRGNESTLAEPLWVSNDKARVSTVFALGKNPTRFAFTAEAGKVYFFEAAAFSDTDYSGRVGAKLALSSDSLGREEVRKYKLSGYNYLSGRK